MKIFVKSLILAVFSSAVLGFAAPALAAAPILSANYVSGSSGSVQITVSNANAFGQINLYTRQSSSLWTTVNNIGQTDGSGYFTQVINVTTDGTASQVQMYVTVAGLQSSTISVSPYGSGYYGGCTYNCGSPYGLSLSQSSVSLTVGQSSTINIVNGSSYYYSGYYISSNSNSSVASAYISGSSVYVNGLSSGSTNISICQNSGSSSCVTLYVTVSGGSSGCGYYGCVVGGLTVSPSSLNLAVGQNGTASVSIGSYIYGGSYYIASNSNSVVASAYVSGSTVYVNGLANGSTTLSICQNSGSSACASLFVTVTGSVLGSNTNLWFSPASPSMYVGQSLAVSINSSVYSGYSAYSYSNSYYISSNTNPTVASASISGTVLNIYANQAGVANITVCHNSLGFCSTLYVTVTGGGSSYYGAVSLSQSSLNVSLNQSANVVITGNSGNYTIVSNSSPTVVSATVSGNVLTVYGQNAGSTTLSICQTGYTSQCASLYVTVPNGYYYGYGGGTALTVTPTSLALTTGQSGSAVIYGTGSYYIASNSNSAVASASVSGNSVSVYGSQNGSTTLSICQTSYSATCVSLYVTVTGYPYYGYGSGVVYPPSSVLGASSYPNGELISENGTVYIVYKNTKTGFISSYVFTGLGFSFNNVVNTGYTGLGSSGYTITSAYASHPWGSWIKSGSTVYFVHESGLIPVPNYSTFIANGGQDAWVVKANSADFRLPILSTMVTGDPRLQ